MFWKQGVFLFFFFFFTSNKDKILNGSKIHSMPYSYPLAIKEPSDADVDYRGE